MLSHDVVLIKDMKYFIILLTYVDDINVHTREIHCLTLINSNPIKNYDTECKLEVSNNKIETVLLERRKEG